MPKKKRTIKFSMNALAGNYCDIHDCPINRAMRESGIDALIVGPNWWSERVVGLGQFEEVEHELTPDLKFLDKLFASMLFSTAQTTFVGLSQVFGILSSKEWEVE